jgi:hypothetical protein
MLPATERGTTAVPILRTVLVGFAAGALSVLVFHQGTVALLHLAGLVPNPPFPMRPVPPLGIPQLANLAFWGGVWGIVIAAILAARPAWPPMLVGVLVGAIGCVLVGFTLVAALRGQPLMAGFDLNRWWRSLLINGAFGWGVGVLLLAARRGLRD